MIGAAVARYEAFFRLPDVTRMLAMAIIARMPIGTGTLALLLHVRALTGSFAAAGAAVGAYLGASAATSSFIGRWIDRRGARNALITMGIASPCALLCYGRPGRCHCRRLRFGLSQHSPVQPPRRSPC